MRYLSSVRVEGVYYHPAVEKFTGLLLCFSELWRIFGQVQTCFFFPVIFFPCSSWLVRQHIKGFVCRAEPAELQPAVVLLDRDLETPTDDLPVTRFAVILDFFLFCSSSFPLFLCFVLLSLIFHIRVFSNLPFLLVSLIIAPER